MRLRTISLMEECGRVQKKKENLIEKKGEGIHIQTCVDEWWGSLFNDMIRMMDSAIIIGRVGLLGERDAYETSRPDMHSDVH